MVNLDRERPGGGNAAHLATGGRRRVGSGLSHTISLIAYRMMTVAGSSALAGKLPTDSW